MQKKYIDQMYDLYEDFHLVKVPLQKEEIRGIPSLTAFSEMLLNPFTPPPPQ
jgi:arsenite-transporting ATPase